MRETADRAHDELPDDPHVRAVIWEVKTSVLALMEHLRTLPERKEALARMVERLMKQTPPTRAVEEPMTDADHFNLEVIEEVAEHGLDIEAIHTCLLTTCSHVVSRQETLATAAQMREIAMALTEPRPGRLH